MEIEELATAARLVELVTGRIRGGFAEMPHSERMRWASALSEFMRTARNVIDPLLFSPLPYGPNYDFYWLKRQAHRQTLTFYSAFWEIVLEEATKLGRNNIRILDAGCGNGIGAQLLATLLRNAHGTTFEITANDYSDNYEPYARAHFGDVKFVAGPVEDIKEKFDLVLCSHLIEHFEDPFPFIEQLRQRASHTVILYAPFREEPLIKGHVYSFDETDIELMGARFHTVITSKAWPGKCFVAVLDGSDTLVIPKAQEIIRKAQEFVDVGAFAKAVEILKTNGAPRDAVAKYLLGFSLHRVGEHGEAEGHLREALSLGWNPLYPNLILAYCRHAVGDTIGAGEYLAKCDAVQLDHPAVIGARKLFAVGET